MPKTVIEGSIHRIYSIEGGTKRVAKRDITTQNHSSCLEYLVHDNYITFKIAIRFTDMFLSLVVN